jgi:hypothetical protein
MESAEPDATEAPIVSTAKANRYLSLVMIAPFVLQLVVRQLDLADKLARRGELPFDSLGVMGGALCQPARHLTDIGLLFARLKSIQNFLGCIGGGHLQHRRHAGFDGAGQRCGDPDALWRGFVAQALRQAESGGLGRTI